MNSRAGNRNSFLHSFLQSAQARHNRFQDFDDTRRWLRALRDNCACSVERVPLGELEQWYFAADSGDLRHRSGKFFSIAGLHCSPVNNTAAAWEQPIILQPEIGILGILTREFDGVRYFLMQAKMEPGNVNLVQLSPTLQATFSNYSQAHKGSLPPYTHYFLDPNARTINSQLQSETGTRFFQKFNRNILLDIDHDVEVLPGFRWLTLYEIQRLMAEDDTVNMDSRSVLSNISFSGAPAFAEGATVFQRSAIADPDAGRGTVALKSCEELREWLRGMRQRLAIATRPVHLNAVRDWVRDEWGIRHVTGNYFEVAGVRVEGGEREVARWYQPLLKHEGLGLSGFLCADIGGVLHFLIQAKPEPGIVGSVELGPTVSLLDYRRRVARGVEVPYFDQLLQAPATAVLHSSIQSEEGGRFWTLRNHVLVVLLSDADAIHRHDNFQWVTLAQLRQLSQGEGVVNSEARTLLACLPLFE
jgi:dTDP-4-dehydro-6-deoxy-alpha-D-glucopyranose 2,3-dehydratase